MEISIICNEDIELKLKLIAIEDRLHVAKLKLGDHIEFLNFGHLSKFNALIDLDVSNNLITYFENKIFDHLRCLRSIDLSNNFIEEIPDKLFDNNTRLERVSFRNNLLEEINWKPFSKLTGLQHLDLSKNRINVIQSLCLTCTSLKVLDISYNNISEIAETSFIALRNLTHLSLNNNKITKLEHKLFFELHHLQYLSMEMNQLEEIAPHVLHYLENLRELLLQNNRIQQVLNFAFLNNRNLERLNLLHNQISIIRKSTFSETPNLMFLRLTVMRKFDFNAIKPLRRLVSFELIYKGRQNFSLRSSLVAAFSNKTRLRCLTLIMKTFHIPQTKNLHVFNSLTSFHVECLEPGLTSIQIDLSTDFGKFADLETLSLRKLNSFTVSKRNATTSFQMVRLSHLDMTGMKNVLIDDYIFENFELLIYLNLSFSEISEISINAFRTLVNLEQLIADNSKLVSIKAGLFDHNRKLKILSLANCLIETIDEFSFKNLSMLEVLDLNHNFLKTLTVNTFYGLQKSVRVLIRSKSFQHFDELVNIVNCLSNIEF